MIAKFSHTPQAVAYACEALAKFSLAGPVELSAVVGGGYFLGTRTISAEHLLETLERECRHFPEATVVVGETESGAPYAAVQCRCQTEVRRQCPHHCEHSASRPLMLILTTPGSSSLRRHILDAVAHEVHNDLKAERHLLDAVDNDQLKLDRAERQAKQEEAFQHWVQRG